MVEEKKCLEETLYCKFLKLLNSKKEYFTNTLKRYTSGNNYISLFYLFDFFYFYF